MQGNLHNSNSLFTMQEYFWMFSSILCILIIHICSLLFLRHMLQPIRIRFTILSCLWGLSCTHANKRIGKQNLQTILILLISLFALYKPRIICNGAWPVTKTQSIGIKIILNEQHKIEHIDSNSFTLRLVSVPQDKLYWVEHIKKPDLLTVTV